jgi:hypothetical protein
MMFKKCGMQDAKRQGEQQCPTVNKDNSDRGVLSSALKTSQGSCNDLQYIDVDHSWLGRDRSRRNVARTPALSPSDRQDYDKMAWKGQALDKNSCQINGSR